MLTPAVPTVASVTEFAPSATSLALLAIAPIPMATASRPSACESSPVEKALKYLVPAFSWLRFTASESFTPSATLPMVLPATSISFLVNVGPPVMVSPSPVSTVVLFSPTFTVVKSGLSAISSCSLPSTTSVFRFAPLYAPPVLPAPTISTVSPSFLATLPLLPWKVSSLFASVSSWLTFTASLASTPSATSRITLFPALIPLVVTLGPSVIVNPSVFIIVLPVVTDSNSGFSAI